MIDTIDTVALSAELVDAALVLCGLNTLMSIPLQKNKRAARLLCTYLSVPHAY